MSSLAMNTDQRNETAPPKDFVPFRSSDEFTLLSGHWLQLSYCLLSPIERYSPRFGIQLGGRFDLETESTMFASLRQRLQDRRRTRMLHRQQRQHRSESAVLEESSSHATIYFDTSQGLEAALPVSGKHLDIDEDDDTRQYPVITTNYVSKESRRMSLLEPETLLAMTSSEPLELTIEEEQEAPVNSNNNNTPPSSMRSNNTINSNSKPPSSSRRFTQRRRTSSFFRKRPSFTKELSSPRVPVFEKGYPGQLTPEELAECQRFDRAMKDSPLLSEMVLYFQDVEEPPYAICRHLRSCKFDAQKQIDKLLAARAVWEEGRKLQFCPDLEKVLNGVPPPLIWALFPVVYHGNAQNGCPIRWIKVGDISPDGLLSLIPLQQGVDAFSWNQNAHVFPKSIQKARAVNPDFVRCEAIVSNHLCSDCVLCSTPAAYS